MSETRSVETTAADIETAIEIGLAQLDVARESVIVEILEEPSRGILGLGARQARIRLTTAAPPRYQAPPAATPEPEPEPAPAPAAAEPRPAPARPAPQARREEPEEEEQDDRAAPVPEDELDDDARVGRATLQELLGKMKIRAEVVVLRAEPAEGEQAPWVLQIRGRDLGSLIGRRGETLAALQYITRLIASRELERRANIVLDVEGYKARRAKVLRRLALRLADQAIQTGRTVSMEPMPPYERRIVHLTLRDHPDVTTESVGEGENRKVTIIPRRR
jgi:spoIIIJ-associated protein